MHLIQHQFKQSQFHHMLLTYVIMLLMIVKISEMLYFLRIQNFVRLEHMFDFNINLYNHNYITCLKKKNSECAFAYCSILQNALFPDNSQFSWIRKHAINLCNLYCSLKKLFQHGYMFHIHLY